MDWTIDKICYGTIIMYCDLFSMLWQFDMFWFPMFFLIIKALLRLWFHLPCCSYLTLVHACTSYATRQAIILIRICNPQCLVLCYEFWGVWYLLCAMCRNMHLLMLSVVYVTLCINVIYCLPYFVPCFYSIYNYCYVSIVSATYFHGNYSIHF